jgi:hypothetical protein
MCLLLCVMPVLLIRIFVGQYVKILGNKGFNPKINMFSFVLVICENTTISAFNSVDTCSSQQPQVSMGA